MLGKLTSIAQAHPWGVYTPRHGMGGTHATVCAIATPRRKGTMTLKGEPAALSSDLDDALAVPYFLWDEPMTVAELRARLGTASPPERTRLLGKILREARDTDVWRFTSPAEVSRLWPELSRHLGRRRAFWEFLLRQWRELNLLDA